MLPGAGREAAIRFDSRATSCGTDPAPPSEPENQMPKQPSRDIAPVPPDVETSFRLWLAAIVAAVVGGLLSLLIVDVVFAATVAESGTALRDVPPDVVAIARGGRIQSILGLALMTLGLGLFLAFRLREGRGWARIALAVFGGIALAGGVVGLFTNMAYLTVGGLVGIVCYVLSIVELCLIVAAISAMFRPGAAVHFAGG